MSNLLRCFLSLTLSTRWKLDPKKMADKHSEWINTSVSIVKVSDENSKPLIRVTTGSFRSVITEKHNSERAFELFKSKLMHPQGWAIIKEFLDIHVSALSTRVRFKINHIARQLCSPCDYVPHKHVIIRISFHFDAAIAQILVPNLLFSRLEIKLGQLAPPVSRRATREEQRLHLMGETDRLTETDQRKVIYADYGWTLCHVAG